MYHKQRIETPWGPSQTVENIADGIDRITTASHGGYRLSADRLARVVQMFPRFRSYTGDGWYEEDCDWAIVALVFTDHFDSATLRGAVRTVAWNVKPSKYNPTSDAGWASISDWLHSRGRGEWVMDRVRTFERLHAAEWETVSMCTDGNGWMVWLTRVGDGARRAVRFPGGGGPEKQFYTDAELTGLETVAA